MPELSVVIITLNEEKQIAHCIDSVQGVADEILVLDSFSTDRTEAICREKGVNFVQHAFDGYIEQKNRALSLARFDFVLSLDADEALSDELRISIAEVKKQPLVKGYSMNRLNNYCGKWIRHCGWYPDKKLRLVDRNHARWEGTNPHDELKLQSGQIIHLKGDLLHYSYHSIKGHVAQANHFTDISAQAMFEKGLKAPIWRLLVNPTLMFLKSYVLKQGYLDGFYGFTISLISAHATFLKYAKLKQLWMMNAAKSRS
ncbi:MAG: glycosyltransferase family 2 protein [Bacteroidales bacterium]|nr:glycosyltransferase family 2 protein [Bacteroidales bacterium]